MIVISPIGYQHLDAILAIESISFSDPWTKDDFIEETLYGPSIVALDKEIVVGYATMRQIVTEGHICNIAVHESHRQKGIGSALLDALAKAAISYGITSLTLEVRVGNRAAMALYHKHGFKVEGYRKDFYRYPTEDAAIMWKYIEVNE